MATLSKPSLRVVPEIFLIFCRLGCTSFGGPVAHLGFFQSEFVERRAWLDRETFSELITLAQTLPGPASSQVGFSIGLLRAGIPGGVAAWLGFTLPSTLLMLTFARGFSLFRDVHGTNFLHGLELSAVAVVAQAVVSMRRTLAPDLPRAGIAMAAAGFLLVVPTALAAPAAILAGAATGLLLKSPPPDTDETTTSTCLVSKRTGVLALAFFLAAFALSFFTSGSSLSPLSLFSSFYRAGSLVFGGGHVVLPLLNGLVVGRGWVSSDRFLAGYGASQALPGPLFAFSAYLGAVTVPAHCFLSGLIALVGIFLPGLLLITGVLPFWNVWREKSMIRAAIRGTNAAVVGLLFASLIHPICTQTVHSLLDCFVCLIAFVALVRWQIPPWLVVLLSGVAGVGLNSLM